MGKLGDGIHKFIVRPWQQLAMISAIVAIVMLLMLKGACIAKLSGCNNGSPTDATSLSVTNNQTAGTTVYVAFGSDSKLGPADWSFCKGSGLVCNFPLGATTTQAMPNPKGKYINATFAFGAAVGCGVTKAEVNINNPTWYDTLDVSMVDGYSNKIKIVATPTEGKAVTLGPPVGKTGNENVYGLFPYGCDVCTARQSPPCGISKGKTGCKAGSQYNPVPPCQFQGPKKGGGGQAIEIALMP